MHYATHVKATMQHFGTLSLLICNSHVTCHNAKPM